MDRTLGVFLTVGIVAAAIYVILVWLSSRR